MNILIISSDNTGSGHKSIGEALMEQFEKYPNVNAKIIEGYSTNGVIGSTVSKSYGFITRRARIVWKAVWNISLKKPELISKVTEKCMRKNFIKLIDEEKPDLILSIHPNFNSPVLNILYKCGYAIPFITLLADLISISPLWVDPRADYIISPTEEAKERCIEFGAKEAKVQVVKFPVRQRFYSSKVRKSLIIDNDPNNKIKFLLMSGGEGVGDLGIIAQTLLNNFNCKVQIITGKNTILKNRLENKLGSNYGDRLKIYGFVTNVNKLMEEVDILITRGSPNVLMEAIASNLPIIITGELLQQEEENSYYMEKYNLGVICKECKDLHDTVLSLFSENSKKLKCILEAQKEYRDEYAVKKVVEFIIGVAEELEVKETYNNNIS